MSSFPLVDCSGRRAHHFLQLFRFTRYMTLRNNVLILKIFHPFFVWSLSNLERTTAAKTSLEKRIRAVSNFIVFITLVAFHSIFLMLGNCSVE